ncbi:MAG: hypothetical protein H6607_04775 [Flavobacteriales bacterium]|nr:hypothetical protein [Flavobacteriales bacterium]
MSFGAKSKAQLDTMHLMINTMNVDTMIDPEEFEVYVNLTEFEKCDKRKKDCIEFPVDSSLSNLKHKLAHLSVLPIDFYVEQTCYGIPNYTYGCYQRNEKQHSMNVSFRLKTEREAKILYDSLNFDGISGFYIQSKLSDSMETLQRVKLQSKAYQIMIRDINTNVKLQGGDSYIIIQQFEASYLYNQITQNSYYPANNSQRQLRMGRIPMYHSFTYQYRIVKVKPN